MSFMRILVQVNDDPSEEVKKVIDGSKWRLEGCSLLVVGGATKVRDSLMAVQKHPRGVSLLKGVDVSCNKLLELPKSVLFFVNLEDLYLSDNQLSYLPEAIRCLTNLSKLQLSNNLFKTIPLCVGHLKNLKFLYVAGEF